MFIRLSRLAGLIALPLLFVIWLGSAYAGQAITNTPAFKAGMQITKASLHDTSLPLRSITPLKVDSNAASAAHSLRDFIPVIPKLPNSITSGGSDASFVQNSAVKNSVATMPAPLASFDGVKNADNPYSIAPPDPQGAIGIDPATGKKYYVQWVNISFQIWDVTDPAAPASVYGPAAGNTLFAGMGGICESNNDGYPITLFDPVANRWVMSQPAYSGTNNFRQCIAVSQTADPTGSWYRYDFLISTSKFHDYPKLGIWPDGYYMSINQFDGTSFAYAGAGAVVFEREKMLSGLGAGMISFDTGTVTTNYLGMLPSSFDGQAPATGTPNYFMEWDDSATLGDVADTLRIWEFKTDWVTPGNSTFGANTNYDPNTTIATANVDPDMCGYAYACIPQPGTANKVNAISGRLMHRLQFRNFGAYKTLVTNHTVDATGTDQAGIHWFELRDTGSGWGMHQQGVYAPDADNRWMGSIAMDGAGNIALGYSVASATTYPSVRYVGRVASDPLGTLPQAETTMIAGGGSQTAGANRWGSYSAMSIDPTDDRTFWYTQEYFAATSGWGWQTRIGAFKAPCIDADGDTYGENCDAGPDCDDSNAAVHPGATEVCNGIDDNCDGQIDEGVTTAYYRDADGDTYGDAAIPTQACTAPAGYVANSTDCNDSNAAVHPGATEVCNGIDDNCDGQTDEGVTTAYYRDADGDTYGDAAVPTQACTAPAGYVANSTDCNDADAFYTDICPTCTVKVIPKTLGWLVGENEKTRLLFVVGTQGTVFDDTTAVKWDSDAITVLSKHVFFKRFMFMKAKFNGAPLEQREYRVLVGDCEGRLNWAR